MSVICGLEDVTMTYRRGEEVTPLRNIDFSAGEGDFVAIEGESGAGKSTFLTILGGLARPTSGEAYFRDARFGDMSEESLARLRGGRIGCLFQNVQLVRALTVEENLALAARIAGREDTSGGKRKEILNRLGLWNKRGSLPFTLSGGQKRRAMLACVWIQEPELILADEPTNDLDEVWTGEVLGIFSEWIANGRTIIMATHNKAVSAAAGRRLIIRNSQIEEVS